jgi:hypothetical protein
MLIQTFVLHLTTKTNVCQDLNNIGIAQELRARTLLAAATRRRGASSGTDDPVNNPILTVRIKEELICVLGCSLCGRQPFRMLLNPQLAVQRHRFRWSLPYFRVMAPLYRYGVTQNPPLGLAIGCLAQDHPVLLTIQRMLSA